MNRNNMYNLTSPQENIWMLENLNKNTNMNNILGTFCMDEILDVNMLQQAINKMIEINEGLRIRIKLIERDSVPICRRV